ncbi:golgi complex component 7 (COG7) domain-containing protein [Ditylenchus destructor]|nr:golgi complex component 7 (COG7) domain-containing protein [Ditylenchus destructor]
MDNFLEESIITEVNNTKFDEVRALNSSNLSELPNETHQIVKNLLAKRKSDFRNHRNDLSVSVSIEKAHQLGAAVERLDKKLQEHTQMLRQNEGSLISGSNTVLEYDSAKGRADKLAEILKAKSVWTNTSEEIQLLEPSDSSLKYQKLCALQRSFDILHRYSSNSKKEKDFEQMKDEFFSWFSSATVLAIDTGNVKELDSLKEKYFTLNRSKVFEGCFGSYARNKIKCFLDETEKEHSLWSILQEVIFIWKRCHKLAETFIGPNGSLLISKNLYDGLISKWDIPLNIIMNLTSSSETPIAGAQEIGKICNDFLSYVKTEGDEHIIQVSSRICQKIYSVMGEGYRKHVTSALLCTINKITAPEKSSRFRHNWMFKYVEEIHSSMREMVNEARSTFGTQFATHIVPSFEACVKELNSLIRNQDILNIKRENADIRAKRSVQENTEDKISAICVTGALINMINDVNAYIAQCHDAARESQDDSKLQTISNTLLLERLNQKVVERKIESIANAIIYSMDEEMLKLKLSAASSSESSDNIALSLPIFSIPPHSYITSVGHGLLNQMNSLSSYASDKNFITAIASLAGKGFNEDEADLWVLTEVGKHVMEAFCRNVGNVSQLDPKLARQFYADVGFLQEALVDLRLQPIPRLLEFSDRLKKVVT